MKYYVELKDLQTEREYEYEEVYKDEKPEIEEVPYYHNLVSITELSLLYGLNRLEMKVCLNNKSIYPLVRAKFTNQEDIYYYDFCKIRSILGGPDNVLSCNNEHFLCSSTLIENLRKLDNVTSIIISFMEDIEVYKKESIYDE
jgi:hypothetical protein